MPGGGAPRAGLPSGGGPPPNIGDFCANWGTRAGGFLIDLLVMAIVSIPV